MIEAEKAIAISAFLVGAVVGAIAGAVVTEVAGPWAGVAVAGCVTGAVADLLGEEDPSPAGVGLACAAGGVAALTLRTFVA